ncbi:MAG: lysozyme inhibitor LprI family protein [Rhodomicrobium sp.]
MDQMTMNECADLAFKKTDSQLNAVYQTIERRLKSGAQPQKLLIAAERAWIAFRDAECAFTASAVAGGSMQPMIYSGCLDQMTKKRIDDLKGFLQCEEGDLSCPLPPAGK